MEILFALLVLALVIILGVLSRYFNIITKDQTKGLSSFVYYFALPALFFVEIAKMDLGNIDYNIFLGSLLPIFVIVFFLFILKFLNLIKKDTFVLLSLSIVFASQAFFGIPFFDALFGERGLAFAITTSTFLGPVGIVASILLFEYATKKSGGLKSIVKILLNPLIISIILGIAFSLLEIEIGFLFKSLGLLGKSASSVAIFVLGMFIFDNISIESLKKSLVFSLFRLILLPFVYILLVNMIPNIDQDLRQLLILQSGIPAAISVAIFAQKFNYKVAEISGIIILTSIGSFFTLHLLYFLV